MEDRSRQDRIEMLGNEIRTRRKAVGLSQDMLGQMVGNGQSYTHRIEAGKVSVGMNALIKIADALDIEVRDLILF